MKKIAIVMGSKSDTDVVKKACERLTSLGANYTVRVLSAHRTPDDVAAFATDARANGYGAIIAAAGKSAALPGAIAAYTTLPVIGLPIKSSFMDGLDSLISMTQMPPGIPVATVGTDAADNAAILAVQMLAINDPQAEYALATYKEQMKQKVLGDDSTINL